MYSPISVSGKCVCHSLGPHCKLHFLLNENIRSSAMYYRKKNLLSVLERKITQLELWYELLFLSFCHRKYDTQDSAMAVLQYQVTNLSELRHITCPRGAESVFAHVCWGWYAAIAISVSLVPSMDLWLMLADPMITYSSSTIMPFECTYTMNLLFFRAWSWLDIQVAA